MALSNPRRPSPFAAGGAAATKDRGDELPALLSLQAVELLAAWRELNGRLLIEAPGAARLGQRTAVRIQLADGPVAATVSGTVRSAHRSGEHFRIELAPDADGLRALRLLLAAARGGPVHFRERQLRWRVRLPVIVELGGISTYMHTFSVAESGCGIAWSGPRPAAGERIGLRFGTNHAARVEAVVRWVSEEGSAPAAGAAFSGRGAAADWGRVLAEVVRGGATPI